MRRPVRARVRRLSAHGDGPTLVLVHGIGMSARSFRRSGAVLARTHPVVTIDLPGFGGVPSPGRALDIEELADVVVGAIRSVGVTEAVVVGQSMGTQVGIAAALRHPRVVRGVVLVSPVVDDRRRTIPHLAVELLLDRRVETTRMNAVLLTDYTRSIVQYFRQLRPMLRYPTARAVAALDVPVLVVAGSRDPICHADWAERLAGAAQDGSLVTLPGPHHVQETVPEEFGAAVSAHLARQRSAPAAPGTGAAS